MNALIASGVSVGDALAQVRARADAFEEARPTAPAPPPPTGRPLATTRDEVDAYLDALATRLATSGLVPTDEAVPVTPAQLRALEARATLPYAYTAFLRRFGGARCRLWSHDHHAVERAHLLPMQRKARALGKRLTLPLPDRAFAIHGNLGASYAYVAGAGGVDEAVAVVCESPASNRVWWASVLGWIDHLLEGAERAWSQGYFRSPDGTLTRGTSA